MCIAVNMYVKSWSHQEALNGLDSSMALHLAPAELTCCGTQYVAVVDDSRCLKPALAWNAGGRRLGRSFDLKDAPVTVSSRLHPKTKLSGCSTCRILSLLCICNIFGGSHPLCPKWAAAPCHTGAKSKVKKKTTIVPTLSNPYQWECRIFLIESYQSPCHNMLSVPDSTPLGISSAFLQRRIPSCLYNPKLCRRWRNVFRPNVSADSCWGRTWMYLWG